MYCVICSKYIKFGKRKISYLLGKTLVFSIICSNWKKEEKKIKEVESIETLKIIGLFENIQLF